jgi:hypothetical protein
MRFLRLPTIVILGAMTGIATAEVTDASSNGFTLVHEVSVGASRSQAWAAAVHNVGLWWNSEHTISGNSRLLSIDARPLGCFCEAAGGGFVHLTVTVVSRDVLLRMTGGLGPLGLMGVNGNMTWEFTDDDNGTKIKFFYAVGGYSADGLDSVAGDVDVVIGEALRRLKAFIETGDANNANAS